MSRFVAPRWLRSGHAQTVWGSLMRLPVRLPLERERWELPDGDFVDVDRLSREAPQVVICHGLEGSSRSGYVRGLCAELLRRGVGAVARRSRNRAACRNRPAACGHSRARFGWHRRQCRLLAAALE